MILSVVLHSLFGSRRMKERVTLRNKAILLIEIIPISHLLYCSLNQIFLKDKWYRIDLIEFNKTFLIIHLYNLIHCFWSKVVSEICCKIIIWSILSIYILVSLNYQMSSQSSIESVVLVLNSFSISISYFYFHSFYWMF